MKKNHPFHLVDMSPWPILSAFSALMTTSGLVMWFTLFSTHLLLLGLIGLSISSFQWWRDVTRESTFQGLHTKMVTKGLKMGMILFITSEVMFFFSFFWAFFSSSLSPSVEIGVMWPPQGITPFNPFEIPLLNTSILLSSGVTVTWAHHSILENLHKESIQGMTLTVIQGIYFTLLQMLEYKESPFTISDSSYGSTFFIATGFHGLHVIIGTLFLALCLLRMYKANISSQHHFGIEAAAWYWHFVDVVWLFLFSSIYWWGS